MVSLSPSLPINYDLVVVALTGVRLLSVLVLLSPCCVLSTMNFITISIEAELLSTKLTLSSSSMKGSSSNLL